MPFFYNSIFKTILLKWFNGVNILDPSDMKNLFTIFFYSCLMGLVAAKQPHPNATHQTMYYGILVPAAN